MNMKEEDWSWTKKKKNEKHDELVGSYQDIIEIGKRILKKRVIEKENFLLNSINP